MTFQELGSGPRLLFLHGVGMRAAAYLPLLRDLARQFHVIAPDLPGAGGTPLCAGELSLGGFAEEVQALLDERAFVPEVMIGHSLGGGVALSLAGVRGFPRDVILIDSVGAGTPWRVSALLARFFLLKNLRVALSPARWPALWRIFPHFLATVGFRPRKTRRLARLALGAARDRHPALDLPGARVTFVAASGDELFPPDVFHRCVAGMKDSRVVDVNGSHDWCLMQPGNAAEVLRAILRLK